MPVDFKQFGSMMSYYCQECGCHINALDPAIYVKVEVYSANPGGANVNVSGWAKKFVEIMNRPIPAMIFCLDCAHDHFVSKLETVDGGPTPTCAHPDHGIKGHTHDYNGDGVHDERDHPSHSQP